jgi:hypothetical protein
LFLTADKYQTAIDGCLFLYQGENNYRQNNPEYSEETLVWINNLKKIA